jgi:hypothetical protein
MRISWSGVWPSWSRRMPSLIRGCVSVRVCLCDLERLRCTMRCLTSSFLLQLHRPLLPHSHSRRAHLRLVLAVPDAHRFRHQRDALQRIDRREVLPRRGLRERVLHRGAQLVRWLWRRFHRHLRARHPARRLCPDLVVPQADRRRQRHCAQLARLPLRRLLDDTRRLHRRVGVDDHAPQARHHAALDH